MSYDDGYGDDNGNENFNSFLNPLNPVDPEFLDYLTDVTGTPHYDPSTMTDEERTNNLLAYACSMPYKNERIYLVRAKSCVGKWYADKMDEVQFNAMVKRNEELMGQLGDPYGMGQSQDSMNKMMDAMNPTGKMPPFPELSKEEQDKIMEELGKALDALNDPQAIDRLKRMDEISRRLHDDEEKRERMAQPKVPAAEKLPEEEKSEMVSADDFEAMWNGGDS